jgi:hypothetical protein
MPSTTVLAARTAFGAAVGASVAADLAVSGAAVGVVLWQPTRTDANKAMASNHKTSFLDFIIPPDLVLKT